MAMRYTGFFSRVLVTHGRNSLTGGNLFRNFSTPRVMSKDEGSGKDVTMSVKDGVAIIRFDAQGARVNTLSKNMQSEFEKIMKEVWNNSNITSAVLISGKPGTFIAGADINMIEECKSATEATTMSKSGQSMFDAMERSPKPIVAAVYGSCLGGGLETVLACQYRIAINDKKTGFGVPEVMIGLLPGAGGTQRLPKHISLPNALDRALTGRTIKANAAKKMGLVDLTINPIGPGLADPETSTMRYLEDTAVQMAKYLASGKLKPGRKKGLMDRLQEFIFSREFGRDYVFGKAKEKVMKTTGGMYPAPLRILDVTKTDLAESTGLLTKHVGRLLTTDVELSGQKSIRRGISTTPVMAADKSKRGTKDKQIQTEKDFSVKAVSASDWRKKHADYFGITRQFKPCAEFFGVSQNELAERYPPYPELMPLLRLEKSVEALSLNPPDENSARFLLYVEAAMASKSLESSTNDLVLRLLLLMKYERRLYRIVEQLDQDLLMFGETRSAKADIAVLNGRTQMTLLVAEEKRRDMETRSDGQDVPWPQLLAEMLAWFQSEQDQRESKGLPRLPSKVLYGIIFRGTTPYFFKMLMTDTLSQCVANGTPFVASGDENVAPSSKMFLSPGGVLEQCILDLDWWVGMGRLDQRQLIFGALEEFKKFVFPRE